MVLIINIPDDLIDLYAADSFELTCEIESTHKSEFPRGTIKEVWTNDMGHMSLPFSTIANI